MAILPAGHWLFQLANIALALSYVSPDVLFLRVSLATASLCFVLWAIMVLDVALDTAIYNALFLVLNASHAALLAWRRRPIKFDRPVHERVYETIFRDLGVSRIDFKALAAEALLRRLRPGSTMIEAGNEAQNLTLVTSGRVIVLSAPKDGAPSSIISDIGAGEWIESPQWAQLQGVLRAANRKGRRAPAEIEIEARERAKRRAEDGASVTSLELQEVTVADEEAICKAKMVDVTIRAETEVHTMVFPMERLRDFLASYPHLASPFNAAIGGDVATKLFRQQTFVEEQARGKRPGAASSSMVADGTVHHDLTSSSLVASTRQRAGSRGSRGEAKAADDDASALSGAEPQELGGARKVEAEWLEALDRERAINDRLVLAILVERTGVTEPEARVLVDAGRYRRILRAGTVLLREGEQVTHLWMMLHGSMQATVGEGRQLRNLHVIAGHELAGSLEYMESETHHIAGETLTAREPCVFIAWDVDDIRPLLAVRPRLLAALTAMVATDLARKFRLIERGPPIDDPFARSGSVPVPVAMPAAAPHPAPTGADTGAAGAGAGPSAGAGGGVHRDVSVDTASDGDVDPDDVEVGGMAVGASSVP